MIGFTHNTQNPLAVSGTRCGPDESTASRRNTIVEPRLFCFVRSKNTCDSGAQFKQAGQCRLADRNRSIIFFQKFLFIPILVVNIFPTFACYRNDDWIVDHLCVPDLRRKIVSFASFFRFNHSIEKDEVNDLTPYFGQKRQSNGWNCWKWWWNKIICLKI